MARAVPRGASRWAFLALSTALLTTLVSTSGTVRATTAAATRSANALVGPIVTSGSELVDTGTGKAVDLKGVNSPSDGFDAASVATVVDWGANFARVYVSDDLYEHTCKNELYDADYVSDLDSEVQALTSAGIFVVLADASTNPGCMFATPQNSSVAPLPGPQSLTMFASLAETFGSNPLVGFEPYNEPEVCPDGSGDTAHLVPEKQLGQDLALAYPENAVLHPTSATSVTTYGTCDGWVGGYPNSDYSNWSQEQANDLAAYALINGGTVQTVSQLQTVTYEGEGFETIVNVLRSDGAANSLVFVDPNPWAANPSNFDHISSTSQCADDSSGSPCWAGLENYVAAEHFYECEPTGTRLDVATDSCSTPDPESCTVVSAALALLLEDPATGGPLDVPVVIDEFGWPQPAPLPEATVYYDEQGDAILMYQHGLFMQNVVSYLDASHVGWAAFEWDNGDQDGAYQGPFVLESNSPAPTSSDTPWAPNADGEPVQKSMEGQTLACQEPPVGFG